METKINAGYFILPAGIPIGTHLVNNYCVKHPTNLDIWGALIKWEKSNIYQIHAAGVNFSCPQDWAEKNEQKIAVAIQKNRQKLKLTQKQLAEAVGTTEQHVQKWEYGERTPGAKYALKLSKALGIPVEELISD
jgi:DNA-binding transcriptional regulator YiaG